MPRAFLASLMRARARLDADDLNAFYAHQRRQWEKEQQARETARPDVPDAATQRDLERLRAGLQKLEEIRQATGIDLRDYTPSRKWVERMRLADSVRLEHRLRLLRDLFADHELRRQVEIATRPDDGDGADA